MKGVEGQSQDNRGQSRRSRPRLTHPDVLGRIEDLHSEGYWPSEIFAMIEEDPDLADKRRPASVRVVKSIVRDLPPRPDPSRAWILPAGTPAERRGVIGALATVVEESQGRRTFVTEIEARLIGQIVDAVPEIPPHEAYRLARRYAPLPQTWEALAPLHWKLAYAPWRSPEAAARYTSAIAKGWIERAGEVHDMSGTATLRRPKLGGTLTTKGSRSAAEGEQE